MFRKLKYFETASLVQKKEASGETATYLTLKRHQKRTGEIVDVVAVRGILNNDEGVYTLNVESGGYAKRNTPYKFRGVNFKFIDVEPGIFSLCLNGHKYKSNEMFQKIKTEGDD